MNDVLQKSKLVAPEVTLERDVPYPPEQVFKAWDRPGSTPPMDGPRQDLRAECARPWMPASAVLTSSPCSVPTAPSPPCAASSRSSSPNRKLRFAWTWDGEGSSPGENVTEVTRGFRPTPTGTRLALRHSEVHRSGDSRDKHAHGWSGCTNSLELYLAGKLTALRIASRAAR